MKKFFMLFSILFSILFLSGCGNTISKNEAISHVNEFLSTNDYDIKSYNEINYNTGAHGGFNNVNIHNFNMYNDDIGEFYVDVELEREAISIKSNYYNKKALKDLFSELDISDSIFTFTLSNYLDSEESTEYVLASNTLNIDIPIDYKGYFNTDNYENLLSILNSISGLSAGYLRTSLTFTFDSLPDYNDFIIYDNNIIYSKDEPFVSLNELNEFLKSEWVYFE